MTRILQVTGLSYRSHTSVFSDFLTHEQVQCSLQLVLLDCLKEFIGLFASFLPIERLPGAGAGKGTGILEVQAVSPPDERSWILDEEITASMNAFHNGIFH